MTQTKFKKQVYEILQELEYTVYQDRPEILSEMPVIVFDVEEYPEWSHDFSFGAENAVVIVDIYANDSVTSTEIKESVISKMVEYKYRVSGVRTIPDPDGYSHLNLQINY